MTPPKLVLVDIGGLNRPNIVVIYTDDQHKDSLEFMPALLDRLASRGLEFRQSFVTTPVCGPSRASFLTGQYTHNHGAFVNGQDIGIGPGSIGDVSSTIATWLQAAGYRTGIFGKYVNGYDHECAAGRCQVAPGWDDWQVHAEGAVGRIYYNYGLSENGTLVHYGGDTQDYSTDVLTGKVLDFIARDDGRPFFAYFSPNAPHVNALTALQARRHAGIYDDIVPWRPPNYDEEDVSDKPTPIAELPRGSEFFQGFNTNRSFVDGLLRKDQLESLLAVDEAIDAIMDLLRNKGIERDTVVIFTTDNGYNWGEHRRWGGKQFPHEENIRVPLFISYPRLIEAPATDHSHLALNIDLAPTIADLAGVEPDGHVDGVSLVPLFGGGRVSGWRADFLIEYYGSGGGINYQGIRHRAVMYAHYFGFGEDEIYNVVIDPYQLTSLIDVPGIDPWIGLFQRRIDDLMTNDALRFGFD